MKTVSETLQQLQVSSAEIGSIIDKVKGQHYQIACGKCAAAVSTLRPCPALARWGWAGGTGSWQGPERLRGLSEDSRKPKGRKVGAAHDHPLPRTVPKRNAGKATWAPTKAMSARKMFFAKIHRNRFETVHKSLGRLYWGLFWAAHGRLGVFLA